MLIPIRIRMPNRRYPRTIGHLNTDDKVFYQKGATHGNTEVVVERSLRIAAEALSRLSELDCKRIVRIDVNKEIEFTKFIDLCKPAKNLNSSYEAQVGVPIIEWKEYTDDIRPA